MCVFAKINTTTIKEWFVVYIFVWNKKKKTIFGSKEVWIKLNFIEARNLFLLQATLRCAYMYERIHCV